MSSQYNHIPDWHLNIDFRMNTGNIHHAIYEDLAMNAPSDNPRAFRVKSFDTEALDKKETRPDSYFATLEEAVANFCARGIAASRDLLGKQHQLHPELPHDSSVTVFDRRLYGAACLDSLRLASYQENALEDILSNLSEAVSKYNAGKDAAHQLDADWLMQNPQFVQEALDVYDNVDHSDENSVIKDYLESLVKRFSEAALASHPKEAQNSLDDQQPPRSKTLDEQIQDAMAQKDPPASGKAVKNNPPRAK